MAEKDKGATTILVGIDGSEGSKAALLWAAQQARRIGAGIKAVWVCELPQSYGWPVAWSVADLMTDTEKALAELIEEVLGQPPGLEVEALVVEGHPAHVLEGLSKQAALVVVGSRGHGGFHGMLLGSVSSQLSHHCQSNLVIVRPGPRAASAA